MKKLLIFSCLMLAIVATQAQSVTQGLYSVAASGTKLLDTITDTGTETMTSGIVKGNPAATTVTATFTKLTGTVAGVATLLGSINGTDWATASSTTYTVTNVASQSNAWQLTGSPFMYYRISTVGSGTSTYTVKGQVLTRNPK